MSTVARRTISPQDYLARERAADFKSEFFDGEMFAMSGASWAHTLIKDNFARAIGNALADGSCRIATSDLRVKVSSTGLYTYSDIVIVCGEPQFDDSHRDTLLNPNVLIEVLSPSTERYDRGAKFRHYRQLASLTEYILVSQDAAIIERFVRQADDWLMSDFKGLSETFDFASFPVKIAMDDIYRGVVFAEPTTESPSPL